MADNSATTLMPAVASTGVGSRLSVIRPGAVDQKIGRGSFGLAGPLPGHPDWASRWRPTLRRVPLAYRNSASNRPTASTAPQSLGGRAGRDCLPDRGHRFPSRRTSAPRPGMLQDAAALPGSRPGQDQRTPEVFLRYDGLGERLARLAGALMPDAVLAIVLFAAVDAGSRCETADRAVRTRLGEELQGAQQGGSRRSRCRRTPVVPSAIRPSDRSAATGETTGSDRVAAAHGLTSPEPTSRTSTSPSISS